MVFGYLCEACGFQNECEINEQGGRSCPDCGLEMTGVVENHDGSLTASSDPSKSYRSVDVLESRLT